MKKYVLVAVLAAISGAAGAQVWQLAQQRRLVVAQEPRVEALPPLGGESSRRRSPPPELAADLTPEERVNIAVYEGVNRSVVNINTRSVRSDAFFIFDVQVPSEGAGSGCVLDTKGHVLTNFHVVNDAREIEVTLADGKSYAGRLVGKDESSDVAVLKIDAPVESLQPVTLGDSTRLRVGQKVFAIGNPFGLERTLTTGVVSSLNRTLPTRNHRTIKSIIQIDAAINPGNSGGPLLDSHGRLIGMNTAIASATGQSSGVGFAIPAANIARVVPQLIERGHVIRPDTGITRVLQTEDGLLIATLAPGGPAERAGLQGFKIVKQRRRQGPFTYDTQTIDRNAADLITAVDGEKVTSAGDFLSVVEAKQPGQDVTLTIVRGGREMQVVLRLAAVES
jgi:S1-C subfamily serine protease